MAELLNRRSFLEKLSLGVATASLSSFTSTEKDFNNAVNAIVDLPENMTQDEIQLVAEMQHILQALDNPMVTMTDAEKTLMFCKKELNRIGIEMTTWANINTELPEHITGFNHYMSTGETYLQMKEGNKTIEIDFHPGSDSNGEQSQIVYKISIGKAQSRIVVDILPAKKDSQTGRNIPAQNKLQINLKGKNLDQEVKSLLGSDGATALIGEIRKHMPETPNMDDFFAAKGNTPVGAMTFLQSKTRGILPNARTNAELKEVEAQTVNAFQQFLAKHGSVLPDKAPKNTPNGVWKQNNTLYFRVASNKNEELKGFIDITSGLGREAVVLQMGAEVLQQGEFKKFSRNTNTIESAEDLEDITDFLLTLN